MRARSGVLTCAAIAAAMTLRPAPAAGQLPNSSTAAFAMGGNFTAIARGFEAVSWNAANLAMPGRPFLSFGLAILGGTAGLAPVDVSTLHKFSGQVIDSATRASWVQMARRDGGQRGQLDGGITPLAFTVGPVGFTVGTSFYTRLNLGPDAWETLLFGNAGNSGGQPKTLDLSGTSVRAAAFTTGALSYAQSIPINFTNGLLRNEHAAVAVTGKYVVGHGLLLADVTQATLSAANNINVTVPVIFVRTDSLVDVPTRRADYKGSAGNGVGADISFAWRGGPWRAGVVAENIVNTFRWDTTMLAYMPGTGTFNKDTSTLDFKQRSFGSAPAELRAKVAAQKFAPAFRAGAAMDLTSSLTLTSDIRFSGGGPDAIAIGPKTMLGVGAEWRVLPFVPLRAGVAAISDGWQGGAGLGLRFLGYELGLSTAVRKRGAALESGVMVGVVGIGR